MITHRPCGACRELVPVETGCKHWRRRRGSESARAAQRKARDDARAAVDAFMATMGR